MSNFICAVVGLVVGMIFGYLAAENNYLKKGK